MKYLLAGKGFGFWYKAGRPHALGQSILPYLLGSAIGLSSLLYSQASLPQIGVGLLLASLGFCGIVLVHLAMNLFDDYFDMRKGAVATREEMHDGGMRARMGKCFYLKDGSVALEDVRRIATVFLVIASLLALLILALRGWEILIFAAITLVLGLAYAGPPLRLSYRGFGELAVGIIFGPILVTASSFVVAGTLTSLAFWVAFPIGLLVANIVNTHAIMDFDPDKAADRMTFPILLGSEKAGFIAGVIMVTLAYDIVIAGVLLGQLPLASLGVFLTIPLAISFFRLLWRYIVHKDTEAPFTPRFWLGPFGDWEAIVDSERDWFFSRWKMARNLVMFFTWILALAALTPWYL